MEAPLTVEFVPRGNHGSLSGAGEGDMVPLEPVQGLRGYAFRMHAMKLCVYKARDRIQSGRHSKSRGIQALKVCSLVKARESAQSHRLVCSMEGTVGVS